MSSDIFRPAFSRFAAEEARALLRQRGKGKTVGLSDCYIAVVARANNTRVLTLDKHFALLNNIVDGDTAPVSPRP